MEVRRSFSSGSKSKTEVPSSMVPRGVTAWPRWRMESASVVLPESLCPTKATLRMSGVSYLAIGGEALLWIRRRLGTGQDRPLRARRDVAGWRARLERSGEPAPPDFLEKYIPADGPSLGSRIRAGRLAER